MTQYTKQQLEERYQKLPDALKEAIFSAEVAEKLFEIGKKNGLTIENVGFMAEETGRVILGLTRPNEFVGVLAERLGRDTDLARKVAVDINHQIFFPLREALKQAHQIEVGDTERIVPENRNTKYEIRNTYPAEPAPLVGGLKVPRPPAGGQPGFLSREEAERLVAEKKAAAPPPKKIPPIDLRNQAPLRRPYPIPEPPPKPIMPLIRPPAPSVPPPALTSKTPAPPQVIPSPATTPPQIVQPPRPAAAAAPQPQPSSRVPTIDLRTGPKPAAEKPKPKPWQGYDPYREPVE